MLQLGKVEQCMQDLMDVKSQILKNGNNSMVNNTLTGTSVIQS